MPNPLEGRLQFAYGLLYDAARWIEQIEADVPQLGEPLSEALDCIRQAQNAIEVAKMDARMKEAVVTIAAAMEDAP